jgi:hypothetical protein
MISSNDYNYKEAFVDNLEKRDSVQSEVIEVVECESVVGNVEVKDEKSCERLGKGVGMVGWERLEEVIDKLG